MSGPFPTHPDLMTANIELLETLSSVSFDGIEENAHPYERASEDKRLAYDRDLENLANQREARERAIASISD